MTGLRQLLLLLLLLSASFVASREDNTRSDSLLHPQFVYHDENWLMKYVHNITEAFPHLTHVYSIGKSAQGLLTSIFSHCWSVSFDSEGTSGL